MKTRLCPPLTPAGAADLHRAFLLDTLERVRQLDRVEVALCYTPPEDRALFAGLAPGVRLLPQGDGDLGARMDAMFTAMCAPRRRGVIALGADLPTLPRRYLDDALARLDEPDVDVVLGPAEDGGYYLIGLRERRPALFRDIAWSTDQVFAQTRRRAEESGLRLATVPSWWDVDTPADLARLTAALRADPSLAPHTRAVLFSRGASTAPLETPP